MKTLTLPLTDEAIGTLHAGESVLLSGTLLTGRDCAHKRICEMLDRGETLPFPLAGETIYYAGPCPAPEGKACGSCGPTTSARMDAYAPRLLDLGLRGMVGKGERSKEVCEAIVRNKAVYFAAIGGAGALYGNAVQTSELVAFPDLLSEAVYRFTVKDFPCIVAIDCHGGNIYKRDRTETAAMTIRIANGECVARSLRKIFPQDAILPFNEAMCEGECCLPVYGDAFCRMRAEAYGVPLADYLKKSPYATLRTIGSFARAELYFDGDMFCAVNALTLLAFLEQEGYAGELWFNHIKQDGSATVLSRFPLPKIGWSAAYECIFLKKQPCKTGIALFDDALPLFFTYKQTDNELLRYAREHAEREENALIRDMMERFRPYGLSDCAAKRFIDRAKEPL